MTFEEVLAFIKKCYDEQQLRQLEHYIASRQYELREAKKERVVVEYRHSFLLDEYGEEIKSYSKWVIQEVVLETYTPFYMDKNFLTCVPNNGKDKKTIDMFHRLTDEEVRRVIGSFAQDEYYRPLIAKIANTLLMKLEDCILKNFDWDLTDGKKTPPFVLEVRLPQDALLGESVTFQLSRCHYERRCPDEDEPKACEISGYF
jgi:hypothetical protein